MGQLLQPQHWPAQLSQSHLKEGKGNTIPAVVGPEIISSAEEIDSKLSDVMGQVSDVQRNDVRMTYLSRPPSENSSHTDHITAVSTYSWHSLNRIVG